jgi:hypothetical protein
VPGLHAPWRAARGVRCEPEILRRGRRESSRRWSAGRARGLARALAQGRSHLSPLARWALGGSGGSEGRNDARTGMAAGLPAAARCVQRFDGSLNSAIHTTYRISLRSSSMPEPRDPLPKVFTRLSSPSFRRGAPGGRVRVGLGPSAGALARRGRGRRPPRQRWKVGFAGSAEPRRGGHSVMIPPLVHQRRPCYDFYFL